MIHCMTKIEASIFIESYLASEGTKVTLTKVSLHQDLGKHLGLVHLEGLAVGHPANDVIIAFVLRILQDSTELHWKACSWTMHCC